MTNETIRLDSIRPEHQSFHRFEIRNDQDQSASVGIRFSRLITTHNRLAQHLLVTVTEDTVEPITQLKSAPLAELSTQGYQEIGTVGKKQSRQFTVKVDASKDFPVELEKQSLSFDIELGLEYTQQDVVQRDIVTTVAHANTSLEPVATSSAMLLEPSPSPQVLGTSSLQLPELVPNRFLFLSAVLVLVVICTMLLLFTLKRRAP